MKDAIVAEHSQNKHIVMAETPIDIRLPDGRFASGNKLGSLTKGFAKISSRVEHILETKPVADIEHQLSTGQFEGMLGIDAVAYRRAKVAIYGLGPETTDVIDRIDGPVNKKMELTGKNEGPIAIVTADCTSLLTELASRATEEK